MSKRGAIVAGTFYPGSAEATRELLDAVYRKEQPRFDPVYNTKDILGCVVPHAGYQYSAYEALHFIEVLRNNPKPVDTFVILNPNHTGYGEFVEVDEHDSWDTPLGNVAVDTELVGAIGLPQGKKAQMQEHSAEVMLPLLQHFIPYPFRIVVISMLKQQPGTALELAELIHKAAIGLERNIMLIASSDFSHFETPELGRQKDELVIREIMAHDAEALHKQVIEHKISVCGYGPIMTLIEYAKRVTDHPVSRILARGHSGKTRPADTVVDYITILFYGE